MKQTKKAILNRIYYQNKKLPKTQRATAKGLNYQELKQLERTVRAKVKAKQSGFDISEIPNLMSREKTKNLQRLSHAIKTDNIDLITNAFNKTAQENQERIRHVKNQFKQLKGFGGLDFIQHAFSKKRYYKNKLSQDFIKKDMQYLYEAIYNKDMFKDYLESAVKQVNEYLKDQNMKPITFNRNNIQETIKKLNDLDESAKAVVFQETDPEKMLSENEVDSDEFLTVDYD